MTADPRAALATLTAALERHLEVAMSRQDPDDPNVIAAAQDLAEAFDDYDEALFRTTEVATPLAIYDGADDDDDDDELVGDRATDRDTGLYSGFDDDEVDFEDDEDEDEDEKEDSSQNGAGLKGAGDAAGEGVARP